MEEAFTREDAAEFRAMNNFATKAMVSLVGNLLDTRCFGRQWLRGALFWRDHQNDLVAAGFKRSVVARAVLNNVVCWRAPMNDDALDQAIATKLGRAYQAVISQSEPHVSA